MARLVRMDDNHFTPAEIDRRITELEGYDRLTNAQAEELDLYRAARETHREQERERRREQLARTAERIERGDDPSGMFGETPNPHEPVHGFQPARVGDDRNRLTAHGPGGEVRDQARRRLDQQRGRVPDASLELVTRTFDRAEGGAADLDVDLLSRWLLVTSDAAYGRACNRMFRDPANGNREFDTEELTAWRSAQALNRNLNEGTGAAGSFLVPFHLAPEILLTNPGAVDPVRELARVDLITTNTWHGVSSAGVTASWDPEAQEVSDDSPTLAQPTVPVFKGQAFVGASVEVFQDTQVGSQVATLFADAKARLEAAAFVKGSGSGQPTGLFTTLPAGSKVATATADVLVAGDVTKPAVALPSRWQPGAAYLANNATAIAIGAFETTAGSLRYPTINESPPSLLRKPFMECSSMDTAGATATAGNDAVLLLGDFQQYLVVDRVGSTVQFLPYLLGANRRPTGEVGWFLMWRTGGARLIDDAFRMLTA